MAGITLEQAQANLDAALTALATSRTSQSYSVSSTSGGRTLQRAQAKDLLDEVKFWERRVAQLSRGGGLSTWSAVPL